MGTVCAPSPFNYACEKQNTPPPPPSPQPPNPSPPPPPLPCGAAGSLAVASSAVASAPGTLLTTTAGLSFALLNVGQRPVYLGAASVAVAGAGATDSLYFAPVGPSPLSTPFPSGSAGPWAAAAPAASPSGVAAFSLPNLVLPPGKYLQLLLVQTNGPQARKRTARTAPRGPGGHTNRRTSNGLPCPRRPARRLAPSSATAWRQGSRRMLHLCLAPSR